jgi:hypothetical protein
MEWVASLSKTKMMIGKQWYRELPKYQKGLQKGSQKFRPQKGSKYGTQKLPLGSVRLAGLLRA